MGAYYRAPYRDFDLAHEGPYQQYWAQQEEMKEVEALDDFLRPPPKPRPIVRKALRIRVDVEGAAMAMQEAARCALRAARVARTAARRAKKCKRAAVYLGAARVSRDAADADMTDIDATRAHALDAVAFSISPTRA